MSMPSNLAVAPEDELVVTRGTTNGPFLFDQGLYGFPDCRSFVLLPTDRDGFYLLQSTEHEALCLLLADPFRLFRGYSVDLPKIDAAALGTHRSEEIAILVTVTLPDAPGRAGTANLQGPLVLNMSSRLGRQVILNKPTWGVRELVDLG